ncbi:MAG: hypothetical protein LC663_02215 [Actinobacteria bacterium]|nr:hypothetical protein [Actinomycetota bacterium]
MTTASVEPPARGERTAGGSGPAVVLAGSAAAITGAAGVVAFGRGIPRYRMPESAPEPD